jgi:hypothetical protein
MSAIWESAIWDATALKTQLYIEFVNWAQCHLCEHWVHLTFCVPQRVT